MRHALTLLQERSVLKLECTGKSLEMQRKPGGFGINKEPESLVKLPSERKKSQVTTAPIFKKYFTEEVSIVFVGDNDIELIITS